MSMNNTKPTNGGSMKVIENSDDVQKRMEEAGYSFEFEAMEASFTEEKIAESTTSSNNNASSDETKKAGDYTKVGASAVLAFKPLIPDIVAGLNLTLKEEKSNKKEKSADEKGLDDI